MRKTLFFTLILSLTACNQRQSDLKIKAAKQHEEVISTTLPISIEVTKDYTQKEFFIQEIATVNYIPLQTTNNILLEAGAARSICVSDSLIVAHNRGEGSVFIFDRIGKIICVFNRKGGSGEEYTSIYGLTVDFEKKEIFILDHYLKYRILVYSIDGNFKRSLKLSAKLWPHHLHDYDENRLICYNRHIDLLPKETSEKAKKFPYYTINKKDGRAQALELEVKENISNYIITNQSDEMVQAVAFPCIPLLKTGREVIISDFSSDTIFLLNRDKKTPLTVRTPTVAECKVPILHSVAWKTDRYLFTTSVKKQINSLTNQTPPVKEFMYDYETNEIYKPIIFNMDDLSRSPITLDSFNCELLANQCRLVLFADRIIELYQQNQLTGNLKEIASKLKEDDNPIVMFIDFNKNINIRAHEGENGYFPGFFRTVYGSWVISEISTESMLNWKERIARNNLTPIGMGVTEMSAIANKLTLDDNPVLMFYKLKSF